MWPNWLMVAFTHRSTSAGLLMSPAIGTIVRPVCDGDLRGGLLQRLGGPGRDHDVDALAREILGDLAADALARAGDERHLPVQLQVHRCSFRRPVADQAQSRRAATQRLPASAGWYTKYHDSGMCA